MSTGRLAQTDGVERSYQFTFPATRRNLFDDSTCTEPDADAITLVDYKGAELSCSSAPFTFCDDILSFSSTDGSLEGLHSFSPIGYTFTVVEYSGDFVEQESGTATEVVTATSSLSASKAEELNKKTSAKMSDIFSTDYGMETNEYSEFIIGTLSDLATSAGTF
jgi:hypothetical protein